MNRALQICSVLLVGAFSGFCQEKAKPKPAPPPRAAPPRPAPQGQAVAKGGAKSAAPRMANPGNNPALRFLRMTPEQQQRLLERATPQQQEQLRRSLENFQRLPPAERNRVLQMYQSFSSLPPETQRLVTRQIAAFNHLPEDRILPVRRELIRLLRMSPTERLARINSDDFKSKYSPQEQQIVSDLSQNLPPDYPLAGR
jgi:Protein of unknown function (DUF3106)/NifQ